MKEIKPIFQDLVDPKMLEECLHGMSRNCNDSFNQLIWNRCPKNICVSKKIEIEIAVNSVVSNHNDGFLALKNIVENLGLNP